MREIFYKIKYSTRENKRVCKWTTCIFGIEYLLNLREIVVQIMRIFDFLQQKSENRKINYKIYEFKCEVYYESTKL